MHFGTLFSAIGKFVTLGNCLQGPEQPDLEPLAPARPGKKRARATPESSPTKRARPCLSVHGGKGASSSASKSVSFARFEQICPVPTRAALAELMAEDDEDTHAMQCA